jgi:CubicO group peptidase (beta-lactamase class C family)
LGQGYVDMCASWLPRPQQAFSSIYPLEIERTKVKQRLNSVLGFVRFAVLLTALAATSVGLTVPTHSSGDPALARVDAGVEAKVDQVFAEWNKPDSPGVALVVVKDGSVIYKKGYGIANLEYDIPVTPSTVFHVASVSKQFTAFAILMLAKQHKLSLDDDIHKYLPELPDYGKTITIRHLCHHISGLRDQWELLAMAGWRLDDVITKEQILKIVRHQKELNFDPGAEFLYSNTGFTLLAVIVERVTGQSFRQWTGDNIFKPLEMNSTHFHDDHEMIVKNRAYSYSPQKDGGYKLSALNYANVGATSLFTTVEDLAKWITNFEDMKVGGPAVIEQMTEQGVLNDGKKIDYAFGLSIGQYRGLKTVSHGGGDAGYRSYVLHFPDQKLGIAVLSNLGSVNPARLANHVADIYLADKLQTPTGRLAPSGPAEPAKVDPAVLKSYVGKYKGDSTPLFNVLLENQGLILDIGGAAKSPMIPRSESTFFARDFGGDVEFKKDETGRVTGLIAKSIDENTELARLDSTPLTNDQLREYVGDYYSDELGTVYTFVIKDGGLMAQHRRHDDIAITHLDGDSFSGSAWWFQTVKFSRDSSGKVNGFRLTGGRVRNVRFDRHPPI